MRTITPIAAAVYERWGDENALQVSHDANNGTYCFWVTWGEGEYDTYTLDGLRQKANDVVGESFCESEHDDEDDEDWFDRSECEECNKADEAQAWNHVYQAAAEFIANGQVTTNLGTVAHAVLGAQADVALNHAARFPEAIAVFSFDADRDAIRNAVIRALQLRNVDQSYIDQFSYEASSNPDIIGVAQRWVTCS